MPAERVAETGARRCPSRWRDTRLQGRTDQAQALLASAALAAWAVAPWLEIQAQDTFDKTDTEVATEQRAALAEQVRYRGGETFVGAYGGMPFTYASDLVVKKPGTELTVHGIDWEGKPFDNPIYYGARVARWLPLTAVGGMIDFTHSKAYAPLDQQTKLSGSRDGQPVPPEMRLGDLFHKLEFTHGHNMLTLNGLVRLPFRTAFVSPYVGLGAGASLPHTEVQFKGERTRTYEYQYTGPAAQFVLGVELRVPRLSYFVEYKFTFADYRAPLQNRDGGWIVFDLANQFRRWLSGVEPDGGWAATRLVSHEIISGMGYRTAPTMPAAP